MHLFAKNRILLRSRFYYALRIHLHKKRYLLRLAQVLRAYIVLGPPRKLVVWYYQKFSNNLPLRTDTHPIFNGINTDRLSQTINEVGYAHVGILPEEYINHILDYCKINNLTRYWNPHEHCEAISWICLNKNIIEVARKYLGAEPILWLTQLKWSFPLDDDLLDLHKSIYAEPIQYDPHAFHYDVLDFKSLTLFIYLTDIDSNSGAHITIENTHHDKTLTDIKNIILDDDAAQKKFGNRIKVISGKKGTAFFEETSSYHKVAVCTHRRLILSIDYVLHRKRPPERPLLVDRRST
jgi:hypothetical protein